MQCTIEICMKKWTAFLRSFRILFLKRDLLTAIISKTKFHGKYHVDKHLYILKLRCNLKTKNDLHKMAQDGTYLSTLWYCFLGVERNSLWKFCYASKEIICKKMLISSPTIIVSRLSDKVAVKYVEQRPSAKQVCSL